MDPPPPPPPPKKKKKKKMKRKRKRCVVILGEGWGELGDGAPVRQLSRRHAITTAIMALLLLAKREPVREPCMNYLFTSR